MDDRTTDDLSLYYYFSDKQDPHSLQHFCRKTIIQILIKRVGFLRIVKFCKNLPLPKRIVNYLINNCSREISDIRSLKFGNSSKYCLYGENVTLISVNVRQEHIRLEVLRDIEKWTKLKHENVCQVSACFEERDKVVVLYQPGRHCLRDVVAYYKRTNQQIPEKNIWKILNQLCSSLMYLNEHKVNLRIEKLTSLIITITSNWNVRIGHLIRHNNNNNDIKELMYDGVYASPEYIEEFLAGFSHKDKQDAWFIGCIAYELVHREAAYRASRRVPLFRTLLSIVQGRPPAKIDLTEGYSENIKSFICVCLTHQRHARPTLSQVYELTKNR